MNRHTRHSLLAAASSLLILGATAGCRDMVGPRLIPPIEKPPEVATGALSILIAFEGPSYNLKFGCSLDGVAGAPMEANRPVVLNRISTGPRKVEITLPGGRLIGCSVRQNPIWAHVYAGETTSVVFEIDCGPKE